LKVNSEGRVGYLYIHRGELLDAEFGEFNGEAAALEVVAWDHAEIEMDGICRKQQRQVTMTLEHLLIEALRLKDERMYAEMTLQAVAQEESPAVRSKATEAALPETGASNVERRPISPEILARKQLSEMLAKLAQVQEYAIFDQKSFLAEKNSGVCSLEEFPLVCRCCPRTLL